MKTNMLSIFDLQLDFFDDLSIEESSSFLN